MNSSQPLKWSLAITLQILGSFALCDCYSAPRVRLLGFLSPLRHSFYAS